MLRIPACHLACRLAAGGVRPFLYGCLAVFLASLGLPATLIWLGQFESGAGRAAGVIAGGAAIFWRFLGCPCEGWAAPVPGRAHAGKSCGAPARISKVTSGSLQMELYSSEDIFILAPQPMWGDLSRCRQHRQVNPGPYPGMAPGQLQPYQYSTNNYSAMLLPNGLCRNWCNKMLLPILNIS